MKTTERLFQSCGVIGGAGGQRVNCVNQQPLKLASISPL